MEKNKLVSSMELFGDFSDSVCARNQNGWNEKYWTWPEETGKGFMSVAAVRSGVSLSLADFQISDNLAVGADQIHFPFFIGFCIAPNRNYNFNMMDKQQCSRPIQSGYGFILHQMDSRGAMEYPVGIPIRFAGIHMDLPVLRSFIGRQHELFSIKLQNIINKDQPGSFFHPFVIPSAINVVIQQIFDAPYKYGHPLRKFFLEGKTLELITYALDQLTAGKSSPSRKSIVPSGNVKHALKAKELILNNLDKAYSLAELARQVGSNKTTLNMEFRRTYGTSVFEYLRIHRLEHAKALLETKKLNVTQTAFEVGYEHPKNFARAFKNHFGISPNHFLK